ncbi:MAG: Hydrolase, HAD superfamily [Microgenomates group bacterium GW2011_GWF2_47_9]|nr:MAG: Hydrolase, HAD superfamily [Microgenomates group bacterium GW2011_GWF2_47_9]
MLTGIKAIGFDVDGTLYHSGEELQILVGKKLITDAAKLLGRGFDDIEEEYLKRREKYRSNTKTLDSFGLPGREIFHQLWQGVDLGKYIKRDLRLVAMLERLRAGIEIEKKLKLLGVNRGWFKPLVACYDHNWLKPEPAPFLFALEKLGLQAEETVYVGDREDLDVEGARAVQMRTILIGAKSQRADWTSETVYDIEQLLNSA